MKTFEELKKDLCVKSNWKKRMNALQEIDLNYGDEVKSIRSLLIEMAHNDSVGVVRHTACDLVNKYREKGKKIIKPIKVSRRIKFAQRKVKTICESFTDGLPPIDEICKQFKKKYPQTYDIAEGNWINRKDGIEGWMRIQLKQLHLKPPVKSPKQKEV